MKLTVSSPKPTVELAPGKWVALITPAGQCVAIIRDPELAAGFCREFSPGLRLVSVEVPE